MKCVITRQVSFFSLISDYSSSIVIGASCGVGVLIAVVVGVLIWWVLMRRKPRQEYTKDDYGRCRIIKKFKNRRGPLR